MTFSCRLRPIFLVFTSSLLLVCGCSRTDESPRHQAKGLADLSDGDDIVIVNKWRLTKGDFIKQRELRKGLLKAAMGESGYSAISKTIDETIKNGYLDTFIQEKLLLTAAEDFFATNSNDAAFPAARVSALEKIHSVFSIKGTNGVEKSFADVVALLPDDDSRTLFASNIEDNVVTEAYFLCAYPGEIELPDEKVAKRLQYIADYNKRVVATNALQYALATNLCERIRNGADFAEVADSFSQDPARNQGGDIGECLPVDYSDDVETWEILEKLKPGEVTPPLHTMQGIEIFKLIEKVPAENADAKEDSLHLARIMLRLAVECRDYTFDELKAEMEGGNRAKRMRETLMREWKRVKIEFPNGIGILPSSVWAKVPRSSSESGK